MYRCMAFNRFLLKITKMPTLIYINYHHRAAVEHFDTYASYNASPTDARDASYKKFQIPTTIYPIFDFLQLNLFYFCKFIFNSRDKFFIVA